MGLKIQQLTPGAGPGISERDIAPDSGLRNGFLMGHTSPNSHTAIFTVASNAMEVLNTWTEIPVTRQRMPLAVTPALILASTGLEVTGISQFRIHGFNFFGQAQSETTPPITVVNGLGVETTVVWFSKPFSIITKFEYLVTADQHDVASLGARAIWDHDEAAPAATYYFGRSHQGIEVPVRIEPTQAAEIFPSPQIISFKVVNHTDPAGFDADNVAELQPSTDEAGSLGGFRLGDYLLNTETVKGWEGYPNKVRPVFGVAAGKTIRADGGGTLRLHAAAAGAHATDTIYYYLEARSGLGTAKTFALRT